VRVDFPIPVSSIIFPLFYPALLFTNNNNIDVYLFFKFLSSCRFSFVPRRKAPYLPSFVLQASQLDERIKNIVSFTFLYGYYQPTLAVLFEPHPTTTARLPLSKDTMCLAIVSIDLSTRTSALINYIENLPYDLHAVYAVPKPIGGVLCVGRNCLLHFDQGASNNLSFLYLSCRKLDISIDFWISKVLCNLCNRIQSFMMLLYFLSVDVNYYVYYCIFRSKLCL
jgi:hypothetical protein